ncbi:NAD(+)/NADH kinase [Desulfurivibrio alkaliphilus]|uniref:NAD kinase n=1 Tax=Desulfurivibrio alkaliphilus (strain DSM 19089 / UNIQEM U267 / AHT2) TaxID=589865 RepID=D6Z2J6_DESAT|nr:NAD(+)/NADH kinase [Desulfurivibrio alkaliphilus]ADH85771.1 NAD(+) kinase [Desulfurivibrio alkaliphilus AHT 2]
MKLAKVGIIIKRDSAEPRRVGGEMADWLAARGVEVVIDHIAAGQDLLIVLGGDGTLLHVAAEASRHGIPVLGINFGGLGFLTEIAVEDRWAVLEKLLAEALPLEERMMLQVRLHGSEPGGPGYALNDVVVSKGAVDQMVELEAWVDGEYLATYRADGLIMASSTGSTAYNLSAGGPVVHPRLDAIVVTPICPFMLESRPVLLAGSCRLEVRIAARSRVAADGAGKLQVIADGRRYGELLPGDTLEVAAAAKKLRLMTSPWKSYFEILRGKLNWGGGR